MRRSKGFRFFVIMLLFSVLVASGIRTGSERGEKSESELNPHTAVQGNPAARIAAADAPVFGLTAVHRPFFKPSASAASSRSLKLVPGGQSIGVRLNTSGVLIVGYHLVDSENGRISPAEEADVRIGDLITELNGEKTNTIHDIRQHMSRLENGKPLKMTIVRQGKCIEKKLSPVKDQNGRQNVLGLYIRDSASGIGTMTFYDPKTSLYGALGHMISDRDTGQPVPIGGGEIVRSTVQSIDRGTKGRPGEKIAFFPEQTVRIGTVNKNTPFGIYGHLGKSAQNGRFFSQKALPVARADEVVEGDAQMLTVLDGNKVQAFDIRIMNAVPQKYPATKGLIIKITDPRLLKETGGIIQGMSGSPIIQNGKIVGAVTHVLVNDPTSGYGVHIEWMLNEAGLLQKMEKAAG